MKYTVLFLQVKPVQFLKHGIYWKKWSWLQQSLLQCVVSYLLPWITDFRDTEAHWTIWLFAENLDIGIELQKLKTNIEAKIWKRYLSIAIFCPVKKSKFQWYFFQMVCRTDSNQTGGTGISISVLQNQAYNIFFVSIAATTTNFVYTNTINIISGGYEIIQWRTALFKMCNNPSSQ